MARGDVDISMLGDRELDRMLKKLPAKVQKKVVRAEITVATREFKKAIVAKTPVGPTGRLKAGIKSRAVKPRKGWFGRRVILPTREDLGIDPSYRWYYPVIVEYGGPTRKAHPFMRPAYDAAEPGVLRRLKARIGKGIERVARERA